MAFADLIGGGAGTISQGARLTTGITAARIRPQVLDGIIYKHAGISPFFALARKLGLKKTVGAVTFKQYESDFLPGSVEIDNGAGYAAGDTTFQLASGHAARVNVGEILQLSKGGIGASEEMTVTAVDTANDQITVTRSTGTTAAVALVDDDELQLMGVAGTENGTAVKSIQSEPSAVTNVTQYFERAIALSWRDMNADVFGKPEMKRLMTDAQKKLQMDIEKAFLLSEAQVTSGTQTITGGVPHFVTTNVTDLSGVALDEANFNLWLANCFLRNQSGTRNVRIFCGTNVMQSVDGFKADILRLSPTDKDLNISVKTYTTSSGTVELVRHGMLDDTVGSQASMGRWGGAAFFINFDYAGRAVYKGGELDLYRNIETPGTKGTKMQWVVDQGLYLANETSHGILKNCANPYA